MGLKKTSALFHNLEVVTDRDEDQSYAIINWVNEHISILENAGFEIEQHTGAKKFLLAINKIDFEIKEDNDWFDINAIVYFGTHAVPFISLKQHILHKKREFTLPDGTIAIIPEKWFSKYGSIFSLSDGGKSLKLKKHHIGLINELAEDGITSITLSRKLQRLNDFENIADVQMPVNFKGDLAKLPKGRVQLVQLFERVSFWWLSVLMTWVWAKPSRPWPCFKNLRKKVIWTGTHSPSLIVMPTSLDLQLAQ